MPAFTKIPAWLQLYSKNLSWKIADDEPNIYLTFDDGPHPHATPVILNILLEYNIKATFFCVGKNVVEYPTLFRRIINEGHTVGNHSWSHLSGWKLPVDEYVHDVNLADEVIHSKLFRPPYGRFTPVQMKVLKNTYKIIMWDILSKDYDLTITDEEVIKNATSKLSRGSIIVLHDNDKTQDRISAILPPIIDTIKEKGWCFKTIPVD